jgi:molybdopterin/thiamine biosynthesis adenylyltransferase
MLETNYARQLTILPPDRAKKPITIIGAGGIGSNTAFCLAKAGFSNITLYDNDTIEMENVPSQFYRPDQAGLTKVEAVKDNIKQFTDIDIRIIPELFDGEVGEIVIGAVDSMKARVEIFNQLRRKYSVGLYIDGRMGGENMRINCLTPTNDGQANKYEKTLYSDDEASPEVCTAKAISYNTFVIAGLITSLVKQYATDNPYPNELMLDLKTYNYYRGADVR